MKRFKVDDSYENNVPHNILLKGEEYYNDERILDIWYKKKEITSYISGNEIYRVKLSIKNNKIDYCTCTCPYFIGNNGMCKHIIAVIYYIKENKIPKLKE